MNEKPRPNVLFIGTGAIGFPMVQHIHRAGFSVVAVEPGSPQRSRLESIPIPSVPDISLAPAANIVIVMVATPSQLAEVASVAGAKNLHGQLWVIMSTVGLHSVEAARSTLERAGARVIDAPVTGGVAGARAGSLRIFTAGAADAIQSVRPVLECCGHVEVVGNKPGKGQAVKIVNQHLCTVHLVAAAEALSLARSMDLDPAEVLRLVEDGAAGSWMLRDRGARMLSEKPEITSTVGIFTKDSALVEQAAMEAGHEIPVLSAARKQLLAAENSGLGTADDSQVIRTYLV